jgi:acetyl esterase/lipase
MPPADPREVLSRPAPPPDTTLHYGELPEHVADVYLPEAHHDTGTLVVVVHGGFWRAQYDRAHVRPLSHALAAAGCTVASIEFRRSGQPGGGWPGTFDDVATAIDVVPTLLSDCLGGPIHRLVLLGHSAGGHLVTWAASRPSLPTSSPWFRPDTAADLVVDLAGVCDLRRAHALGLDDDATGLLMGGGPDDVPERYAVADPAVLLPAAPVVVVHGTEDDRVPVAVSRSYVDAMGAAGTAEPVHLVELTGVEHFALIDPLSPVWPAVLAAIAMPH